MLKQFQVKNESLEKERLEAEFCGREGARVMAGLSSAVELTIDRMGLEGRLLSRRQMLLLPGNSPTALPGGGGLSSHVLDV